jgi:hypothetical protein
MNNIITPPNVLDESIIREFRLLEDKIWTEDELVTLCNYFKTLPLSNNSPLRFTPPATLRLKLIDLYVTDGLPSPLSSPKLMPAFRHELMQFLQDDDWVYFFSFFLSSFLSFFLFFFVSCMLAYSFFFFILACVHGDCLLVG